MPDDLRRKAISLGFIDPKIVTLHLTPGESFGLRGFFREQKYSLQYRIAGVEEDRVDIGIDGFVGGATFAGVTVRIRLEPNRPIRLSRLISFPGFPENLYLSVISLDPEPVRPIAGGSINLALGEISDTEPPPRRPPPSR